MNDDTIKELAEMIRNEPPEGITVDVEIFEAVQASDDQSLEAVLEVRRAIEQNRIDNSIERIFVEGESVDYSECEKVVAARIAEGDVFPVKKLNYFGSTEKWNKFDDGSRVVNVMKGRAVGYSSYVQNKLYKRMETKRMSTDRSTMTVTRVPRIIDRVRMDQINGDLKKWRLFNIRIAQGKHGRVYRILTGTPIEVPITSIWGTRS